MGSRHHPDARAAAALRDAAPVPFWLDRARGFEPQPRLVTNTRCDLAVVGGGFTGLWTALLAKERDPSLDVALIEADLVGAAASGRNGGFCMSTLTHSISNGAARFEDEMPRLESLGLENLLGIEGAVQRYGIECDWRRSGEMAVATEPWQVADTREYVALAARFGRTIDWLGRDELRAEVDSPTYLAAWWDREGCAMVDPARLAWGLAEACRALGVRLFERTPATGLARERNGATVLTPYGSLHAGNVALATNAFPSLVRRVRPYVIPVYDYALATEPIPEERWAAVGWRNRQGISGTGNRFDYYSRTVDGRIVWGGFDAVYHFGSRIDPTLEQRPRTFEALAGHLFETFPQLEGVRFTHAWGGVIDACTRFAPFFGRAMGGHVACTLGYTGMGVGASRFGARVMLDLLAERATELTRLSMVKRKPIPFPPEPLRSAVVKTTFSSLARADRNDGRRNLWLRASDRLGVGLDT